MTPRAAAGWPRASPAKALPVNTPAPIALPLLLATLLLAAACTPQVTAKPPAEPAVGLANPASTHCLSRGGKLEIRKDAQGGEAGFCHLPDGRVIEEWTLFRQDQSQGKAKAPGKV